MSAGSYPGRSGPARMGDSEAREAGRPVSGAFRNARGTGEPPEEARRSMAAAGERAWAAGGRVFDSGEPFVPAGERPVRAREPGLEARRPFVPAAGQPVPVRGRLVPVGKRSVRSGKRFVLVSRRLVPVRERSLGVRRALARQAKKSESGRDPEGRGGNCLRGSWCAVSASRPQSLGVSGPGNTFLRYRATGGAGGGPSIRAQTLMESGKSVKTGACNGRFQGVEFPHWTI